MSALQNLLAGVRKAVTHRLPVDPFGRHVLLMGAGTAFVQALGVLAAPVLTRLYSPADFGVIAAFGAAAEIMVLLATLKLDLAVPIAESDEDAAGLLGLSLAAGAAFSALTLLAVAVLPASVFALLSPDERLYRFRWYFPLALLGGAAYATLLAWAIRRQRFGTISRSRATQSLASVGVQVAGGLAGLGVLGLILGAVSNMASGLSILWRAARHDTAGRGLSLRPRRIWPLAQAYWRFPAFSMPTALLNQTGRSAPTLLLSSLHGATTTGFYSMGLRVVGLPSALVSSAVGSVVLSTLADARAQDRIPELSLDTIRRLSGAAVCLHGVLIAFGPQLFGGVLGHEWSEAGHYVRLLSPWLFLMFVFSPLSAIAQALLRQALDSLWQLLIFLARAAAIVWPSAVGYGPRATVAIFAAVSFCLAGFYFSWILRIAGVSLGAVLKLLAQDIMPVAAVLGLAKLAQASGCPPALAMGAAMVALFAVMRRRLLAPWGSMSGVK